MCVEEIFVDGGEMRYCGWLRDEICWDGGEMRYCVSVEGVDKV